MQYKDTVGGINRHHHRPDLEQWYDENIVEQIVLLDSRTIDVIGNMRRVQALQAINRELDRRLRPTIMPGRVDIYTELKELN